MLTVMLASMFNEALGPTNRPRYNSRQRLPSTESEDSSNDEQQHGPTEEPTGDEFKFTETSHADLVSMLLGPVTFFRKEGRLVFLYKVGKSLEKGLECVKFPECYKPLKCQQ